MPFNASEHHDSVDNEDFVTWEWEGYLLYWDGTQTLAHRQRFEDQDAAVTAACNIACLNKRSVRVCQETWSLNPEYEPKDIKFDDVPPCEAFEDDCLSSDVVDTLSPDDGE